MYETKLIELMKMIKKTSLTKDYMEQLIEKMNPLLKSYAKKIFFMEYNDAYQELCLCLIESVVKIKNINNENQCLSYIKKCILHKYCYLCRKNITKQNHELIMGEEIFNIQIYKELEYNNIEIFIDLNKKISLLPLNKQKIIKLFIEKQYTDKQISVILGISRQYINRVKNNFFTSLYIK